MKNMAEISMDKNELHEEIEKVIKSIFDASVCLTEDAIYDIFMNLHSDIEAGVYDCSVINGSILYLKHHAGLASADIPFYKDKDKKLSFFIKDYDASFLGTKICVHIKGFNRPLAEISLDLDGKHIELRDASYKECVTGLKFLMESIATLLTWHYKWKKIDKQNNLSGGEKNE